VGFCNNILEKLSKMAVGKNKRLTKSKKGSRKKAVDPFQKKEWYNLLAPSIFSNRNCGKTLITKTIGTKIASDGLKGRVVELSLADLNSPISEDNAFRKIKLCIEDVQGYNCLLNFHGMDITRDKLCSLIRKKTNYHRRKCRCPYYRRLHCPNVLHCIHEATRESSEGDVLREGSTNSCDSC